MLTLDDGYSKERSAGVSLLHQM